MMLEMGEVDGWRWGKMEACDGVVLDCIHIYSDDTSIVGIVRVGVMIACDVGMANGCRCHHGWVGWWTLRMATLPIE